ncbi:MAG TPA: HD domain-containing protein [bacterium]|nr:HD domain-containing protein [bacterium]
MDFKCPGTDARFLKVEQRKCPACGYEVEIFSDEFKVSCPGCHADVFRSETPSCIDWCRYAKECVGEEKLKEMKGKKAQGAVDFRERLITEMKRYFGADSRRILHAERVTCYAEKLLDKEKGARSIVMTSAVFHDIGIRVCEEKYGSSEGDLQEKEGPAVARGILEKLGLKEDVISEVCEIIGSHHTPGRIDTLNFKIVWDADNLVKWEEQLKFEKEKVEGMKSVIREIFFTDTGRLLAGKLFSGEKE